MSRLFLASMLAALLASASARADELELGDPMRPFVRAPQATSGNGAARPFRLTGVLIGATRRVAVINGAVYREGETVNSARVVRIEPGTVHLQRNGEAWVLQLERRPKTNRINNGEPVQ